MESEIFINSFGLARRLQLPRAWLIAEANAGRIPSLRVGSRHRFNVDAVCRALAQRASSEGLAVVRAGASNA